MFYRVTDASKAALAFLLNYLRGAGYTLFDVQWTNEHTRRLGAKNISRNEYLARLTKATSQSVTFDRLNAKKQFTED